jgi:Flp pilus assembly protein TadD
VPRPRRTSAPAGARPRRPRPTWLPALLIAAAAVASYANSFDGAFIYDDIPAIVDNPHVRSLWPIAGAMAAPAESTLSGRPIGSLSFAVNYAFAPASARAAIAAAPLDDDAARFARFERTAWTLHAGNLLIHMLAALALYGVVRRTLVTPPLRDRVGAAADALGLTVAVLWLVHPLATNAVTYLVQRVESLASLFFLLTLYAAIRAHDRRRSTAWAVASVIVCALGMATKPTMAAAPMVVWLWDVVFAGGGRRARVYASLASTWAILAALVWVEPRAHAAGFGFAAWPWWRYLATEAGVVLHYLRLVVLPAPLVFNYDWPPVARWTDAALPVLLLAVAAVVTVFGLLRRHPAAFAAACVFMILAPTSSVLPIVTEVAAEHRMYLPLAAVLSVIVVGGYLVARSRRGERAAARVGLPIALAVIVGLGAMTSARNRDYESDLTMWADTVAKQPSHARAHMNYGVALGERGRLPEAEAEYRTAERLAPDDPLIVANLGSTLAEEGKFDDALPLLVRGVALRPADPDLHRHLADAHAAHGDPAQAVQEYLAAIALRSDDALALNKAARILMMAPDERLRDRPRALGLAERAVTATGRQDPGSLDTLAVALAELDRFPEAAAAEAEAVALARGRMDGALVAGFEARLALFQAGRKFGGPAR